MHTFKPIYSTHPGIKRLFKRYRVSNSSHDNPITEEVVNQRNEFANFQTQTLQCSPVLLASTESHEFMTVFRVYFLTTELLSRCNEHLAKKEPSHVLNE